MNVYEGKMLNNKSQYIDLAAGSDRKTDNTETKYKPETRTVYLSGKNLRLFRNRKRGIPLHKGDHQSPPLGIPRLLKILFYGLSFGLVVSGAVMMIGKKEGE